MANFCVDKLVFITCYLNNTYEYSYLSICCLGIKFQMPWVHVCIQCYLLRVVLSAYHIMKIVQIIPARSLEDANFQHVLVFCYAPLHQYVVYRPANSHDLPRVLQFRSHSLSAIQAKFMLSSENMCKYQMFYVTKLHLHKLCKWYQWHQRQPLTCWLLSHISVKGVACMTN